jgi:alginate O-acetyltransferase complex protein AlgJ
MVSQTQVNKKVTHSIPWFALGFIITIGLGFIWVLMALPAIWSGNGNLQARVAQGLPLSRIAVGLVNSFRYRFLATADDQVHLGKAGWLYLQQELHQPTNAENAMQTRARAVIALATALKTRGVHLLLAVVPNKARIHPAYLEGAKIPFQNGYTQWLELMQTGGVATVALDTALLKAAQNQSVFLKTDTHWNTIGAKIAAQTISAALSEFSLTRAAFITTKKTKEYTGDLIHLMGLEDFSPPLRPNSELEMVEQTQNISVANLGLLGAPQSEVVLVGTSYSLRSNFSGALKQALGTDVLNLAREGSGFERSMTAFLKDPMLEAAPPKVLIWEFSERFLYLPISGPLPVMP